MEKIVETGVLRIQIKIRKAKILMNEDPAAAAAKLEQAESLCEEIVEILEKLVEGRKIREEMARIEKQTRMIQLLCQKSNRKSGFGSQSGNA